MEGALIIITLEVYLKWKKPYICNGELIKNKNGTYYKAKGEMNMNQIGVYQNEKGAYAEMEKGHIKQKGLL